MLKFIYKKIFWVNYDYLLSNIVFSLLWFIFQLPILFLLFVLIFTKSSSDTYYILLINLLFFNPASGAISYATSLMVKNHSNAKKISNFWKGIKKFWLKSLLLFITNTIVYLILYKAFIFYATKSMTFNPFVQLILAGIILWISIYYLMMSINFFPILVNQKEKFFKIFYKSFLLVLDNLGIYFLLGIFFISITILFVFSILGFILLFSGFYFLSLNILTLSLLSKYNSSIKIEEETRKFKHLLKPWE